MRLIKTLLVLGFIFTFNFCKDVVFNNPFDPNASKEDLKILKTFTSSLSGEGDITYDGEKIWKTDTSGTIYAFETVSGTILRTLPVFAGFGIACYDNLLYLTSQNTNTLKSYDPLSGVLIKTHSTGKYFFKFIASYQDSLIAYDSRSSNIVSYNPESADIISLFQVSGFNPGGISIYNNSVIISEVNSNSVYFFDLSGNIINVYNSPVPGMYGICVDSANLYIYLFTINGNVHQVTIP